MIKAVLFDFDGVIVKSEELHKWTFLEVLKPYPIDIEERWYYEFAGTGSGKIFKALLKEYSIDADVKDLVEKRRELFMREMKTGAISPMPGLKEFLSYLRQNSIKSAIVSGGHRGYIEELNRMLGISEYFDFVVSADDIPARKPDPEPFLLAARTLGVHPADCIVIEDSYSGCEAARRANMKLVWVRPHPSMKRPDCDLEVKDLADKGIIELLSQ